MLACQLAPQFLAYHINVFAKDIRIGTGEIYKLENAGGRVDFFQWEMGRHPILVDFDNFPRLYLPDELGLDQIECAALRGNYVRIPQFTQAEGPEAVRVTDSNHTGLCQEQEAVGSLDPVQCIAQP